jgi:hypothetical protein
MWGIWSVLIVGAVGAVFLLFALAVGASPVFAIVIFAIVAAGLGALLVARRGAEQAQGADEADWRSTQPQPRSGGAPVSGEGGVPPR